MLSFLAGLLGTHTLIIIGVVAFLVVAAVLYFYYRKLKAGTLDPTAVVTTVGTSVGSSLFSGIFGSVASVATGLFSSVTQYFMIGLIVTLVATGGAFYLYYGWSQDQLQLAAANQQKLEDAINQQRDAFDRLKKDADNLAKNYKELQQKQNEIQKQNDLLQRRIQQYNFQDSAIKNHDQTEKDINDETAKMLKNLENITDPNSFGSPTEGK